MGHLFSRAIKRLTFGGSGSNSASRSQLPGNEQQEHAQSAGASSSSNQREQDLGRPTVQAIPVGQSIDSAEYAAFEDASRVLPAKQQTGIDAKSNTPSQPSPPITPLSTPQSQTQENVEGEKENAIATTSEDQEDKNTPEVEEAVIKIQALVRGHLTRKALKDAQQQAASVAPHALGQRHFDEESLIKNPPSAIFLPTSPLSSNLASTEQSNGGNNNQLSPQPSSNKNSRVPPLASIAEDVEIPTVDNNNGDNTQKENTTSTPSIEERERRKLSGRGATQTSSSNDDSTSPTTQTPSSAASEANASIDIHCDTPASASIDILDHHSKQPTFGLASVLHHNTISPSVPSTAEDVGQLESSSLPEIRDEPVDVLPDISGMPTPSAALISSIENNHQTMNEALAAENTREAANTMEAAAATLTSSLPASPPHIHLAATTNSHSIDSAEAAAIRIQSAFRGYHTRKHSPYRRRSPAGAQSGHNQAEPKLNGYGGGGGGHETAARRNFLRQQDATAMEDGMGGDVDDDDEADEGVEVCERLEDELARTAGLEVVSPDEAIGSGRSSPALVSSNGDNSSDDADGEQEEGSGGNEGTPAAGASQPVGGSSQQQQQQQAAGGGQNKNKRKNRNKRKGGGGGKK